VTSPVHQPLRPCGPLTNALIDGGVGSPWGGTGEIERDRGARVVVLELGAREQVLRAVAVEVAGGEGGDEVIVRLRAALDPVRALHPELVAVGAQLADHGAGLGVDDGDRAGEFVLARDADRERVEVARAAECGGRDARPEAVVRTCAAPTALRLRYGRCCRAWRSLRATVPGEVNAGLDFGPGGLERNRGD
jgi:hypothetical protein